MLMCWLQGLVDLDVEIAKADKKLQLAQMNLEKVRKVEAQPDYENIIAADVRLLNEEKVRMSFVKCDWGWRS
jgi:valyl-tRNA synthetase